MKTPLVWLIALAGLFCLTITWALGGLMVHGPDADPLTRILNNIIKNM
jgi:hypothetical protein